MNDVRLVHPETLEHVQPTNESQQRDILDELRKLESSTSDVKFQALVLVANEAKAPVDHGCKNVAIWTASAVVSVGDSDDQPVLLVQNIWRDIPINQVGSLRFKATAAATVYIVSSN
jgi:hypothetical protein